MKIFLYGIVAYILLLISGCSILSPAEPAAKKTYLLNINYYSKTYSFSHQIISVAPITSVPWLNTSKMAYQKNQDEIEYFALNQWAAPPAELLQPVIIQALESSGKYKAVLFAPNNSSYDKQLEIKILNFQQVFTQKPSYYLMTLNIQVINQANQQTIFSKIITLTQQCPSDDPAGGVAAVNHLIQKALPQWVKFIDANNRFK